eukprot:TRINITY_DN1213_c1_g1_i2.p1 TRINITY_DN1213_c1_g1~~TRINITY_DN1213_c1_g1_i2.p1  ORF type:complete len:546 (+),score=104.02 TRINITY_DN1213_c1_g1_i2:155-1792(+)
MDMSKPGSKLQDLLADQDVALRKVLASHQEIQGLLQTMNIMPAIAAQQREKRLGPSPASPPAESRVALGDTSGAGNGTANQLPSDGPAHTSTTSTMLEEPLLAARANERRESKTVVQRSSTMMRRQFSEDAQPGKAPVFPNHDTMKQRLLEKFNKPAYDVESLYSSEGIFQHLARAHWFQKSALLVIVANTLWIAVDTDMNKAEILCDAAPVFQIVNNFFCSAFVIEIMVRFLAFEVKLNCLADAWFVFDACLVGLMVWETWIEVFLYKLFGMGLGGGGASSVLRIFRILRLTRVARLARLVRQMPELMILIKGMAIAARSVLATLTLLLVIIYIFAVVLTQQLSGTGAADGCFENVPTAINCLLLNGVFTEEREFIAQMLDVHWTFYVITIFYLLLASLTVLNMLIGVLCEVVAVTARVEQEELMMQDLKAKIVELMPSIGEGNKFAVSKQSFEYLLDQPEAVDALRSVDVDLMALVDFQDFIFRDEDELPLGDFMEKVLQFRSTNTATVKDVVDFRVFLQSELKTVGGQILDQLKDMKTTEVQ